MRKIIASTLVFAFALFIAACGAGGMSEEEVLEKAQQAEVEGHPGIVFDAAFEQAFEYVELGAQVTDAGFLSASIDWYYGWFSENDTAEQSLGENERPVHCVLSVTYEGFSATYLDFIFDTEKNILIPVSVQMPNEGNGGTVTFDGDGAAACISSLYSIFELGSTPDGGSGGEISVNTVSEPDTPPADAEPQAQPQAAGSGENDAIFTEENVEAYFWDNFPDALGIEVAEGTYPMDGNSYQVDGFMVYVVYGGGTTYKYLLTYDDHIYDATDFLNPQLIR